MTFTIATMALLGFGVVTGYLLGWCHRADVDAIRRGEWR